MNVIEKINYKNKVIRIGYDEFSTDFNLIDDLPTGSKICLSHQRYNFENNCGINFDDYESWEEVEEDLEKEYGEYDITSIFIHQHGLVRFNLSQTCPWDSGQIGFILIPKIHDDQWFKLDYFLEYWTACFNGHVYEWLVYDISPCCGSDEKHIGEHEAGGGYICSDKAIDDAKAYIDGLHDTKSKK